MRLGDLDALEDKIRENIRRYYSMESEVGSGYCTAQDAADEVKYAPTIEAEPVWHGRWVYRKFVSSHVGAIRGYMCSECSSFVNEDIFDSDEFRKVFCGCCGALMDLEGEG